LTNADDAYFRVLELVVTRNAPTLEREDTFEMTFSTLAKDASNRAAKKERAI